MARFVSLTASKKERMTKRAVLCGRSVIWQENVGNNRSPQRCSDLQHAQTEMPKRCPLGTVRRVTSVRRLPRGTTHFGHSTNFENQKSWSARPSRQYMVHEAVAQQNVAQPPGLSSRQSIDCYPSPDMRPWPVSSFLFFCLLVLSKVSAACVSVSWVPFAAT